MTVGTVAPGDGAGWRSGNPFARATRPIIESDDELQAVLNDEIELPPLLPALAALTGDSSLLETELRPDPTLAALPQGGLSDPQQCRIRTLATRALIAYRDGGCRPAASPSDDALLSLMEFAVGGNGMDDYLPLLEEELAFRGEDRRAPDWTKDELAPDRRYLVAIIGAGMSGLLVAYRLQQAGVPFVILEKDEGVGGTWLENTYPGCRVDNPNHAYSYSFAQRHDWPFHFSPQPVLLEYFERCAEAFDLRRHVRFGTEVVSATWSEEDHRWTLCTRDANGVEDRVVVDAVVSAVGQLNRPSFPRIDGRDAFDGPAFHSAQWDHSTDLVGKRVAVIGTGASAVQFVPEVAQQASKLTVFQRTPPWLAPTSDYHDAVSAGQRWLYEHVPGYSEWNRFWIFWRLGDAMLDAVRVDPDWLSDGTTVGPGNALMRMLLAGYLEAEFADRPDLLSAVVPQYPPGAKRLLRDNGVWVNALKRDNVHLATTPISAITPDGVTTADGEEHRFDVIIYGTGFTASRFLTPITVRGRRGLDLHEHWGDDARAYLGITIPGFPNFFCLYGPNTNIVINGSIIYFSECGARYILGCLRLLLAGGHRDLEVRKDVHDEFNERVDAENGRMAWGHSDVPSWYKNEHGRITQNWPFTLLEYWQRTLAPNPDEYLLSS